MLDGGAGDDVLKGGSGDDVILAGDGDDILKGGSGSDTMIGGEGLDKLYGHRGDDTLEGGAGDDILKGGSGDDILRGGEGDDTLLGGSGDDVIVFDQFDSVVKGGSGYDTLMVSDESLDLSDFGGLQFEEINLDEAIESLLTLDSDSVKSMTDGDNELKIVGNEEDTVQLDGDWQQGESIDGFTSFTNDGATVMVDDNIVDSGNVTVVV